MHKSIVKEVKERDTYSIVPTHSILAGLGRSCFLRWQQEDLDIDDFEDCGGFIKCIHYCTWSSLVWSYNWQTRKSTFSASSHWPRVAIVIVLIASFRPNNWGLGAEQNTWIIANLCIVESFDWTLKALGWHFMILKEVFYGFLIVISPQLQNGYCRLELTCLCGNLHEKFVTISIGALWLMHLSSPWPPKMLSSLCLQDGETLWVKDWWLCTYASRNESNSHDPVVFRISPSISRPYIIWHRFQTLSMFRQGLVESMWLATFTSDLWKAMQAKRREAKQYAGFAAIQTGTQYLVTPLKSLAHRHGFHGSSDFLSSSILYSWETLHYRSWFFCPWIWGL